MRTAITAMAVVVVAAAAATTAVALASGVDVIRLPDGFVPEGITSLGGPHFLVGSLLDGRLWAGNYASGTGVEVFNAPDQSIVGVVADPAGGGVAWAAGGESGNILAFGDGGGTLLANLSVPEGPADGPEPFVNDGDVVRDGAMQFAAFTDSFSPAIYTVPLSAACGDGTATVQRVPLTGDFMQGEGFNANGMRYSYASHTLVMVQSNTGKLFTVATDGLTKEIDVGGSLAGGDGILFDAVDPAVLYVVQNTEGRVAVVRFAEPATLGGGRVVATLVRDEWSTPTTAAQFAGALYVVDSRFDVAPPGGGPAPDVKFFMYRVEQSVAKAPPMRLKQCRKMAMGMH